MIPRTRRRKPDVSPDISLSPLPQKPSLLDLLKGDTLAVQQASRSVLYTGFSDFVQCRGSMSKLIQQAEPAPGEVLCFQAGRVGACRYVLLQFGNQGIPE